MTSSGPEATHADGIRQPMDFGGKASRGRSADAADCRERFERQADNVADTCENFSCVTFSDAADSAMMPMGIRSPCEPGVTKGSISH